MELDVVSRIMPGWVLRQKRYRTLGCVGTSRMTGALALLTLARFGAKSSAAPGSLVQHFALANRACAEEFCDENDCVSVFAPSRVTVAEQHCFLREVGAWRPDLVRIFQLVLDAPNGHSR